MSSETQRWPACWPEKLPAWRIHVAITSSWKCGGHTHTIYKHGIEDYLPPNLTLVHGPGCPVCVIPMGRVDDAIHMAAQPEVILTTFGDMMRVPGGRGAFLDATARGADIRMVYSSGRLEGSAAEAGQAGGFHGHWVRDYGAVDSPTVLQAAQEGVRNFTIFCNHVTIIPAMKAILDAPDLRLDGFIGPGHVSTVIGRRPYEFITRDFAKPVVIAGFEPLDIPGHLLLLKQLAEGRCAVENQYTRVVPWNGNGKALQAMHAVMELRPSFEWRGLGFIPHSALKIRDAFAGYDAERRFAVPGCASPTSRPASVVQYSRACSNHGSARCSGSLHSGDTDRDVHGVFRGGVCRVLPLRTVYPPAGARGRGDSMREPEHIIQAPTSDPEPARSQHRGESLTKEQQVLQRIESACGAAKRGLQEERITMAHGAGGRATATLIEALFLEAFRNRCWRPSRTRPSSAWEGVRLAFTTDSFVVSPLFFPGGNIGDLAVNGTVNDLAVSGARPLYLGRIYS